MNQLISKLEVSINQRFDHISILTIDAQEMYALVKDEEKKRMMVKNFRIIKNAEKNRIIEETKCIGQISKLNRNLSKTQIIVCENMIANCINQYLNTQYLVRKNGDSNDLIDIKANNKVKQMMVIKNCKLLQQLNFIGDNLQFFLSNVQLSINCLYQSEKNKFFTLMKQQNKSISPERRIINEQQQQQRFDESGNLKGKKKKQLQSYCFQLSKLLNLEHIYIDYYYFSSINMEKRKKMLESNFLKRNVYMKKLIQIYQKQYINYKVKLTKAEKKNSEAKMEKKCDEINN